MKLYIFTIFIFGVMVFLFFPVKPSFAQPPTCPVNMVKAGPICVDKYEVSVWSLPTTDNTPMGKQYGSTSDDYPCSDNGNDCSKENTKIFAASLPGVIPSSNITWFQAQQACFNVGKRLLTNAEWQGAAAGTPDNPTSCNISTGSVEKTDAREKTCVSNWGVVNMVGNLEEYVGDWIQGNTSPYSPSSGTAGTDYGDDLMLGTNPAIVQGVNSSNFPTAPLRGGRFSSASFAGVFGFCASGAPTRSLNFIGFRCAK